ncbi:MAG: hypothetical protein HFF10_10270 [Angelakisella sp.]|jgi:hypothetical protein|nr:hypothetical protein [Angelakisella sp.]
MTEICANFIIARGSAWAKPPRSCPLSGKTTRQKIALFYLFQTWKLPFASKKKASGCWKSCKKSYFHLAPGDLAAVIGYDGSVVERKLDEYLREDICRSTKEFGPDAKKAEVLGQIKGLCEELGHLAKEL